VDARWFDFELADLARFGGDLERFAAWKADELARLEAEEVIWYEGGGATLSTDDKRACQLLALELERVAAPLAEHLIDTARRIAAAITSGELDWVIDDCVMYSPVPDRAALTRRAFEHDRALMRSVAAVIDGAHALELRPAEPASGMPAWAAVWFGPIVPAPEPPRPTCDWHARYGMEFWWSGQVMPAANGPRFTRPGPDRPPPGRWRFYRCVAPGWVERVYRE